ncbi:MAG TPA: hypothetical protein VNN74_06635 [Candidatus Micrarchaeia archaeon]|nr:hypothetical protein [Candidatus Micrarchaeia archaeon]
MPSHPPAALRRTLPRLVAAMACGASLALAGGWQAAAAGPTAPASSRHAGTVAGRCGAPPNPFHYTLCPRGRLILHPARAVCRYFRCIGAFWAGRGYMVECRDRTYSRSGGRRGACSDHHGEWRPVRID